jgi:drug/metabolite transporter (DMT)-like permease
MVTTRTVANIKGVLTILLWSSAALFISWTPEIPPFLLAAFTSAFGCILFGFRWVKNRERLRCALRQPWGVWCLFAVAVVVYRGCYLSGLKIAPTVEANLINYLWPLLIVVFGAIAEKTLPKRVVLFGACLGLAGVYFLLEPSLGLREGEPGQIGVGHLLALLGAISWSGYSVMTRRMKVDSNDLLGVMHGLAVITFGALHFLFENPVEWRNVDLLHWIAVCEVGLAISLGYSWWDEAMSKGSQQQIAIGGNFIPLLSTVWLIFLGHQVLTWHVAIAAALIISGSYIAKKYT